jgi:outer membrane protein OmpA-like peptidoglycan-associated protein
MRPILAGLLAILTLGCSGPSAQLTRCQQDKEQLLATIREQRDTNRTLAQQVASLETRLDESEKELARRGSTGTRLSSRPESSRQEPKTTLPQTPLPWRAPGKSSEPLAPPVKTPAKASSISPARSATRLASHDRGASSAPIDWNGEIPFDGSSDRLTLEGRNKLDELVRQLKSKDAADLNVRVGGNADRARAVLDYLDSHGIASDRLALDDRADRTAAGIEIFLAR